MDKRYLPYILIAPATLFLGLFFLYPFFLLLVRPVADGELSLKHFQDVTRLKPRFQNTLYLTAAVVPVQLAFALLMATMVTRMQKGGILCYKLDDPAWHFRSGGRDCVASDF